jgi:hypothetical protein
MPEQRVRGDEVPPVLGKSEARSARLFVGRETRTFSR